MKKLHVVQNKIMWNIYDGDRYTWNASMHVALDVRTLNEDVKRACAKLYQASGNTTTQSLQHWGITTPRPPDQIRYYISRSQMQATYEWRTDVAVAANNNSNTWMDTPHLRNQGHTSVRCFYPHIIIHQATSYGGTDGPWNVPSPCDRYEGNKLLLSSLFSFFLSFTPNKRTHITAKVWILLYRTCNQPSDWHLPSSEGFMVPQNSRILFSSILQKNPRP
jgi:hypothetical protein